MARRRSVRRTVSGGARLARRALPRASPAARRATHAERCPLRRRPPSARARVRRKGSPRACDPARHRPAPPGALLRAMPPSSYHAAHSFCAIPPPTPHAAVCMLPYHCHLQHRCLPEGARGPAAAPRRASCLAPGRVDDDLRRSIMRSISVHLFAISSPEHCALWSREISTACPTVLVEAHDPSVTQSHCTRS